MIDEEKREMMRQWASFKLVHASDGDMTLKITDFEIMNMIGKGSVSNVYLVRKLATNQPFALKVIQKEVVQSENLFESIKLEKDLLLQVYHHILFYLKLTLSTM